MPSQPIPLPRDKVVDHYFMEHRAKLIDIAAYLDRVDRAQAESSPIGNQAPEKDFRHAAFEAALEILTDGQPDRARRVLEFFSDPTTELPQSAQGVQGAAGAYLPASSEGAQ